VRPWSKGMMEASHAFEPGSSPGGRTFTFLVNFFCRFSPTYHCFGYKTTETNLGDQCRMDGFVAQLGAR
jgi:hypothetical protein